MTKFVELIERFTRMEGNIEDNREKLYVKEAILLIAVPEKWREEYCRDRGYIITNDPETLINWMREVDKRKKKKFKEYQEGSSKRLFDIMDNFRWAANVFVKDGIKYRFTLIIEEL